MGAACFTSLCFICSLILKLFTLALASGQV
jgi:hypothetical protein